MNRKNKKAKETLKQMVNMMKAGTSALVMLTCSTQKIYAATTTGVPVIDKAFATIKAILLGIVALIGAIILIKGIMDCGNGIDQRDSSGIYDGLREIAAGLIMAGAGVILGLIGIA